jgi:hypothetical protein
MDLIMKDLYLGEEESSRNSLGSYNSYAREGCSQHGLGAGKSMAVVAAHMRAFRSLCLPPEKAYIYCLCGKQLFIE